MTVPAVARSASHFRITDDMTEQRSSRLLLALIVGNAVLTLAVVGWVVRASADSEYCRSIPRPAAGESTSSLS